MQIFAGLGKEENAGMTLIGRIIRDAWVFSILPEGDDFSGRSGAELQLLADQVHQAWELYGHLPSRLPSDLAARHERIHAHAMQKAREQGWSPELGDDD